MRPAVGILIVWVVVSLLALAGGWSLMFFVAWALLLLLGAANLLAILGLRALYFSRETRALRAEVGSYFDERVVVENVSWLPKLWLEIEDRGQHPVHTASLVVSLGPYGRFVRPVHTVCRQRGTFQLGPVIAHSGDPFGLFRYSRQVDGVRTLVVYPVAVPLSSFGAVPGALSGGALRGERVPFTTPNVSSVREYQPGDTFNRIHWPSTARQRRLMVKEFELDPFSDVWLILDLDAAAMTGDGPESTEEYAVTVCASLAKHFLDESRAVGLVTQEALLTPDRGTRQVLRSLELLAAVRPRERPALEEMLLAEQQRFGRTSSLVMITASPDDAWVRTARTLRARGVAVAAVMLDGSTFGQAPSPLLVAGALAAGGVPTYVVKRGDDLRHVLAGPSFATRAAYG